jgi:predicted transcriptional regulator of viral defense system
MADYQPHGYPVRVMTPERTLVDGLQQPDLCGGIETVLRAWVAARDLLDVERVIEYTERFDVVVLRQRVGYVLEAIGLGHPTLETWRRGAHRGGSSKLVGSASYAPVYSERWNLSLNAPVAALEEAAG